jgi:hypothetical protein
VDRNRDGIATQLKRKMVWDPVKELLPKDEQANRVLSYARQPGGESDAEDHHRHSETTFCGPTVPDWQKCRAMNWTQ